MCSFAAEFTFTFSIICYCLYLNYWTEMPRLFFGVDLVNFGEGMLPFMKFVGIVILIEYIEMAAMETDAALVGIRKKKTEMAAF